ncbi:MAG: hypothetical protein RIK87_05455 [Fuerstiella sp.]
MSDGIDFAALAEQLEAVTRTGTDRGRRLLQRRAPGIVAQIRRDAARFGPLSFWGRCRNVDELAGATIVDPGILQLIADIAGRNMSTTSPHAGLQHTYGYLFSRIETPYGFKRERWLETEIENAFGLHPTTMGPAPQHGTLLANIHSAMTW